MSLLGTISSAQHGMAFATLARRLGVREEDVAVSVAVLLPELLDCISASTATPNGTISFLRRLSAESYANHYESPSLMVDLRVRDLGLSILSELSAARCIAPEVIIEAAMSSELRTADVERMLPFVAVLTVAAITLRTDRPMRALLGELLRNPEWARRQREPFGPLAAELARRAANGARTSFGNGIFAALRSRFEPRQTQDATALDANPAPPPPAETRLPAMPQPPRPASLGARLGDVPRSID